jgi:two-component system, OmpR family, sensor histidine kinase TctE
MAAGSMLSLRFRLLALVGSLFIAGMFVLYIASNLYGRTAADRSFDRLLAASAMSIAETISIAPGSVLVDVPYAALDMLGAAPDDRVFYQVSGPDGATVTGYEGLPDMAGIEVTTGNGTGEFGYFDAPYRGETVRFARLSREIAQPGVSGSIVVQVGHTRRARDALVRELVVSTLMPIALVTLAALALVWFGIGGALRPLDRLRRDIEARKPSDLQPLGAPAPTEIQPLIFALNDFMRRLGGTIDMLRAFVADAAHQVRTPLAALRAQVQAAADDDPEEIRRSLETIDRSASRLTRLVNQLLSDAAVMHRSHVMHFDTVDLVKTVTEAIQESVSITDHHAISFECRVNRAHVHGDSLMLREAIKNVIDNAMLHGDGVAQGVDVILDEHADVYSLRVLDHGPGIEAEHEARIFERFARGDDRVAGAGLGLAIVRQAIGTHGGRVLLHKRDGGGLIVECLVPDRLP